MPAEKAMLGHRGGFLRRQLDDSQGREVSTLGESIEMGHVRSTLPSIVARKQRQLAREDQARPSLGSARIDPAERVHPRYDERHPTPADLRHGVTKRALEESVIRHAGRRRRIIVVSCYLVHLARG